MRRSSGVTANPAWTVFDPKTWVTWPVEPSGFRKRNRVRSYNSARGDSSAGRAPHSHCGGREFESLSLHQPGHSLETGRPGGHASLAVVLVSVQGRRSAVRAGVWRQCSRVVGVGQRLLDVLKCQVDLVAGHRDRRNRNTGDQDEDERKLDHRLAPTSGSPAQIHGLRERGPRPRAPAIYVKRNPQDERSDPYERPNVLARAVVRRYATAGSARLSASATGVLWGMRAKAAQIRMGAAPATTTTMRASSIWFIGAASNRKQPMLSTRPIPRHSSWWTM